MASFVFTFDKSNKIYKPGETVHCKVQISVFSKFLARSLSIRFKGFAHTGWKVSNNWGKSNNTSMSPFTGDEEYFKNYQYMFGSEHSSEQEVTAGTHTYNVSFVLPRNIPKNFEHEYGHIRYNVKAKYDIAWAKDLEGTEAFYITTATDLNEFPSSRDPVKQVKEKRFGICCCESNPLQLKVALPKTGFVPGETIPITIEVDNNSDVRINYVRVKLKEYLTLICLEPNYDTRVYSNTVRNHFFEYVARYQKREFQTTIFLDPSYDFKFLNGCNIIKCEYYIETVAEAEGCYANADDDIEITIGTIPFHNTTPAILAPTAPTIFNPAAPTNGVVSEQPLPSYNDVASPVPSGAVGWNMDFKGTSESPPSFEESQKNPSVRHGQASKAEEAGEETPLTPSAPAEPIASATAPPE